MKELQWGGCWQKTMFFGFVFIVKLLWELNAKQGMNTLELEWKQKKLSKP
jgi:hypothetical protein